jgi:hypothetical protein
MAELVPGVNCDYRCGACAAESECARLRAEKENAAEWTRKRDEAAFRAESECARLRAELEKHCADANDLAGKLERASPVLEAWREVSENGKYPVKWNIERLKPARRAAEKGQSE